MIIGIGIDIVSVSRFEKWYDSPRIVKRFFHPEEYSTVIKMPKNTALQSLAARFAAKEAFVKALGTGFKGIALADICIHNNALGKPELLVYNSARDAFVKSGADYIHVSLSHEKEYATAFIILERHC